MSPVPRLAYRSCAHASRIASTSTIKSSPRIAYTAQRRWQSSDAGSANTKISGIVDQISQLTLLETADLVATLKSRLNIPDMPMGGFSGGGGGAPAAVAAPVEEEEAAPKQEEKTLFNLKLQSFDATAKPKVIKEIKSLLGLSLVDSKKFVESAPKMMKEVSTYDSSGLGPGANERIVNSKGGRPEDRGCNEGTRCCGCHGVGRPRNEGDKPFQEGALGNERIYSAYSRSVVMSGFGSSSRSVTSLALRHWCECTCMIDYAWGHSCEKGKFVRWGILIQETDQRLRYAFAITLQDMFVISPPMARQVVVSSPALLLPAAFHTRLPPH